MSQPGSFIEKSDLPPEQQFSWALMAHSAINNGSGDDGCGAGGILAASPDIEKVIMAGDIGQLFIWPNSDLPAGLYLWHGTIDEEGDQIGVTLHLHPDCMQHWIDNNGQMA